jgi:hypothetical protein
MGTGHKEWGHDGYRQLLYLHAFRARSGRAIQAGQVGRSEAWRWSGSATFAPVITANRSCLASMPPIAFDHEPELVRDDFWFAVQAKHLATHADE